MLDLSQNIKYKIVEDDSKIIISTNCLHSVNLINSFLLSTDEDVTNYYNKFFRYSVNFGIDFSELIELNLTNLQDVIFENGNFSIIEIHLIKKGNPTFYSFSINLSYFPIELELNFIENTYLDFEGDYSLVVDLAASLIRKVNFSILPKFVERTKDFLDLFYAISFFLSIIKRYALKIRKYDEYIDFLNLYLNQSGLFTCKDQPIEELTFLKETLFNEFRRRGTESSFLKSDELNEISNGEVLRMICYENCDEFILDNTKPEQIGWNLGNSSPLNRHLYNHNSTNKNYEKFTKSIIDLDKYPLIDESNCSIEIDGDESYLKVVSSGGIGSETFVEEKAIIVDPNLDYEISFLISVSSVNDAITFKVSSFDCLGEIIGIKDLTCLVTDGEADNFNNIFLEAETLPFANKWILVRGIIFRKWLSQQENYLLNKKLNINKGTNLRFSDGISKIIPCILLESGGEIKIKDLRIQPLKTVYSQGFLQTNNWTNIWLKDNNSTQNRQTVFIGVDNYCEIDGEEFELEEQIFDYKYFEKDLVNSLFGFSNLTYQNLRQFFINYDSNFWINFLGNFKEVEFKDCIRPEGYIPIDEYCEETRPEGYIGIDSYCQETRPEGFIGIGDYCEDFQDGLFLDGVNDYLIANRISYPDSSFTINLFFEVDNNDSFYKPVFATENYSSSVAGDGIAFYVKDNNFEFWVKDSNVYVNIFTVPQIIPLFEVQQITIRVDGSFCKFFINSDLIGEFSFPTIIDISNKILIGSIPGHSVYYFEGVVYDLKIFEGLLDDSEIIQLFNTKKNKIPYCSTIPIFEANFNEKSGFIASENINNYDFDLINYLLTDVEEGGITSKWIRKSF